MLAWAQETEANPDALSPTAKQQLGQIAAQQGFDPEFIFDGMRRIYDRGVLKNKSEELGLEQARANIAQTRAETAEMGVGNFSGISSGVSGSSSGSSGGTKIVDAGQASAIKNSFNAIASRLTKDQKSSLGASLNSYLQAGDLENANNTLMSAAIASLPSEQQNKAFGRMVAMDELDRINGLLADYQTKGGNTNLLKGTQEKIFQKLGETGNPELAQIGNAIQLAMVSYRNAVSGAAFTEAEAKQYEQLFPSTSKSLELNRAKIQSLKDSFNNNQRSTLSTVLGGKQNYDTLINGNKIPTTNQSPVTNRVKAENIYLEQTNQVRQQDVGLLSKLANFFQ